MISVSYFSIFVSIMILISLLIGFGILVSRASKLIKVIHRGTVVERVLNSEKELADKITEWGNMRDAFSDHSKSNLITFEDLRNQPFDLWSDWVDGVRYKRIKSDEHDVYYTTEMNPELSKRKDLDGNKIALFSPQLHNCLETCSVEVGHMIDKYDNDRVYLQKETAQFPAFKRHHPGSKMFSVYSVSFKDPIEILKQNH